MAMDLIEEMYKGKNTDYFSLEREVFKNAIQGNHLRILDIGCGAGLLGAFLREKQECTVYGVEINEEAYQVAKTNLNQVIKANIELVDLPSDWTNFDAVIMGDVLEHLINPVAAINKLLMRLQPKARIYITVPNIRYWKTVLSLVFADKWEYESWGILDYTHLRFFTKKSITDLLKKNGMNVVFSKRVIQKPSKSDLINTCSFGLFAGFLASHTFLVIEK